MSAKNKMDILRDVILFSFSGTKLWTGRAKLRAEDLGLDEDDVPEEAVASLGSKRVIDKEALKPLNNNRYKMKRLCHEMGMRFMGGYAVAEAEAEALVRQLDALVKEGDELKRRFLRDLDVKLEEWQNANPQWSNMLRAGTPAREKIANRIQFGYVATMVASPKNSVVARALNNSVDQIGGQLVDQVVAEARTFVKTSLFDGRDSGHQKTVDPMRRLVRKVYSLRFIDPALGELARVLQRVLDTIPTEGKVQADAFLNLTRVANLVADRERFVDMSKDLHEGRIAEDDLIVQLTGQQLGAVPVLPIETVTQADLESEIASLFETTVTEPMKPRRESPAAVPANALGESVIANVLASVHAQAQVAVTPTAPATRRGMPSRPMF